MTQSKATERGRLVDFVDELSTVELFSAVLPFAFLLWDVDVCVLSESKAHIKGNATAIPEPPAMTKAMSERSSMRITAPEP